LRHILFKQIDTASRTITTLHHMYLDIEPTMTSMRKPRCNVTTFASTEDGKLSLLNPTADPPTANSSSNHFLVLQLQLRLTTAILQPSYILPDVEQSDEPQI